MTAFLHLISLFFVFEEMLLSIVTLANTRGQTENIDCVNAMELVRSLERPYAYLHEC